MCAFKHPQGRAVEVVKHPIRVGDTGAPICIGGTEFPYSDHQYGREHTVASKDGSLYWPHTRNEDGAVVPLYYDRKSRAYRDFETNEIPANRVKRAFPDFQACNNPEEHHPDYLKWLSGIMSTGMKSRAIDVGVATGKDMASILNEAYFDTCALVTKELKFPPIYLLNPTRKFNYPKALTNLFSMSLQGDYLAHLINDTNVLVVSKQNSDGSVYIELQHCEWNESLCDFVATGYTSTFDFPEPFVTVEPAAKLLPGQAVPEASRGSLIPFGEVMCWLPEGLFSPDISIEDWKAVLGEKCLEYMMWLYQKQTEVSIMGKPARDISVMERIPSKPELFTANSRRLCVVEAPASMFHGQTGHIKYSLIDTVWNSPRSSNRALTSVLTEKLSVVLPGRTNS